MAGLGAETPGRAAGGPGVSGLWEHQLAAAEHVHRGQNVILATGTASGKTLAYLVPAVAEIFSGGTVLYLTPTKRSPPTRSGPSRDCV